MKKVILIVGMLSVATFQISCKKDGDIANSKSNAKVDNMDDANSLVDFNNDMLAEYKSKTEVVDRILQYASQAVKKASGENNVMLMPIISTVFVKKVDTVPKAFGKDKDVLDKELKTFKDKYDNIKKKAEELKSYMSAEDYKDDKGAKAASLYKEIEADANIFLTAGDAILDKMKPAVDVAEQVTLKDHPLKDYIISSKKVLNALDASYAIVDKQFVSGKFNEAEAQKSYDDLAKSLEANVAQKFDVKDAQYAHKSTSYDDFNKKISNYLDGFRKVIRDSKAAGSISESDINTMDSDYDSVINSYNSFVN